MSDVINREEIAPSTKEVKYSIQKAYELEAKFSGDIPNPNEDNIDKIERYFASRCAADLPVGAIFSTDGTIVDMKDFVTVIKSINNIIEYK